MTIARQRGLLSAAAKEGKEGGEMTPGLRPRCARCGGVAKPA
jgi:hypothetical protein